MKKFLYVFLFFTISTYGQSVDGYLKKGAEKYGIKDYRGAIKYYNKALVINGYSADAFFNRGLSEMALNELLLAELDFNQAILLDNNYANAYYSKAIILVKQERFTEALPLLDKAIELNAKYAYLLRGQISAQTGNKAGACADFNLAKEFKQEQADFYISKYCGKELTEYFEISWPSYENWKKERQTETDNLITTDFIHKDESIEKWNEFANSTIIKNAKNVPLEKAMKLIYEQAKLKNKNAVFNFIDKNDLAENPWILFTINLPKANKKSKPESQLWYLIQGKSVLYTNYRALKIESISENLLNQWTLLFKNTKVLYK